MLTIETFLIIVLAVSPLAFGVVLMLFHVTSAEPDDFAKGLEQDLYGDGTSARTSGDAE